MGDWVGVSGQRARNITAHCVLIQVVETIDACNSILHMKRRSPAGRMDLVLLRSIRSGGIATHESVISYRSVVHPAVPLLDGYKRATVDTSGFILGPETAVVSALSTVGLTGLYFLVGNDNSSDALTGGQL